ncbi:endoplasmic reticulum metallopeptidase 1-like [Drosophila teissieri]|uniref:endoplasmic reticulum metallopeptidase 1-like n=1 Tax=Drosophila teissieri TaxID=7243 RepID=UPI001CB9F11E|nr:endoplasmic reticulum metallopeptidase 1-like [Drosophila teissieri]
MRERIDRELEEASKGRRRLSWYYVPSFLVLWLALFFAIVIPLYNRLPKRVSIAEEPSKRGEFVAERAGLQLHEYEWIGPKVVGSRANEVETVKFLLGEVERIEVQLRSDLYELEVDVQEASGGFLIAGMWNMYQGIQNVIVKLSTKESQSESYLLINSHFDSKPGSPGSGDDGTMVVVMLEVLRQMATSATPFQHGIIFLFNGAEENALQGAHGFITQHKWAPNCRALINLESGGSGGRDLLFQSGPNTPWLMKYYRQHAKHPFATTLAEETWQAGIIPSDTDFRIFRDFGHVPGLDIAQADNGYVYHTAFDTYKVISERSIQNTGNNILALARAFANASELSETENTDDSHAVFFDFLGLFLVYYTETTGIVLNCVIGVLSLVLVGCSLWRMSRQSEKVSLVQISIRFLIILGLHFVGLLLCICLPLLVAVLFDAGDRSLTYFTSNWLVFGLYVCPAIIGLVLPLTLYFTLLRNDKLSHPYLIQMSLHAEFVVLALLILILTAMGTRSQYLCLISLIFYGGAVLINLISTLHDRGYYWSITVLSLQVIPFCYFSYLFYMLLVVFFPITGRNGIASNPDLIIALLCGICTYFAMGFVAQFINVFRWPNLSLLVLGVVSFIFCMITVFSEVGFPYRAETNVMRVNFMQTKRIFYDYEGAVTHNDSGYYFVYQDRRGLTPLLDSHVNLTGLTSMEPDCDKYVMCGAPCFNSCGGRRRAGWLPRAVNITGNITLQLLEKSVLPEGNITRFEFKLTGPPQMNVFIQPVGVARVTDWSFERKLLEGSYQPPYFVYFSYGKDDSPLKFFIEVTKSDGHLSGPIIELGVVGHFVSNEFKRDAQALEFLAKLPNYVHAMEWPSIFKGYIF